MPNADALILKIIICLVQVGIGRHQACLFFTLYVDMYVSSK